MSAKIKENKNSINIAVSNNFNESELTINSDKMTAKVNKIH